MKVRANGISIEVEDTGEADRPAVLLVMGLGMQLVSWPPAMVAGLQQAGFRVVRFDNRDAGLSQSFPEGGVPNLLVLSLKHHLGLRMRPPYTLRDMADDSVGVLDALGIARAHVVGVSMGGMVAQRMAIAAPQRVATLTSIMSTSGAPYLPPAKAEVLQALLRRPADRSEDASVDNTLRLLRVIASPAFPLDEALARERVLSAVRRAYNPDGVARQLAAVAADTRRYEDLPRITCPALVVHGVDDPFVPFACGQDTARRIPGARLVPVRGMGHDLPPPVVDRILGALLPHIRQTAST
jgi:pimeloyl-ACP methyl ester carboxylesterase